MLDVCGDVCDVCVHAFRVQMGWSQDICGAGSLLPLRDPGIILRLSRQHFYPLNLFLFSFKSGLQKD